MSDIIERVAAQISPKLTAPQLRALRALDEPRMWDQWKGQWRQPPSPRSSWLRQDVMWRCVGLMLVEHAPNWHSTRQWQLSEAGKLAAAE